MSSTRKMTKKRLAEAKKRAIEKLDDEEREALGL